MIDANYNPQKFLWGEPKSATICLLHSLSIFQMNDPWIRGLPNQQFQPRRARARCFTGYGHTRGVFGSGRVFMALCPYLLFFASFIKRLIRSWPRNWWNADCKQSIIWLLVKPPSIPFIFCTVNRGGLGQRRWIGTRGSSRERHRDKMSLLAQARRPDSPPLSQSTPSDGSSMLEQAVECFLKLNH